jgi:hypothetical protein
MLCNGRSLALPINNKPVWNGMTVANTLAYYVSASITAVKGLYITGLWCNILVNYRKIFKLRTLVLVIWYRPLL